MDESTKDAGLFGWADTPWIVAALLGAWGAMIGIEEFFLADMFMALAGVACILRLAIDCFRERRRRWLPFVLGLAVILAIVGVDFHLTKNKRLSSEAKERKSSDLVTQINTLNGKVEHQSKELSVAQGKTDQHVSDIQEENKGLRASIEKKDAALVSIAKQQYALNYAPQLLIIYDPANDQLELTNKGKTNIEAWGGKVGVDSVLVRGKPTIIAPETFEGYYNFKSGMIRAAQLNHVADGPLLLDNTLFIRTLDGKKYIFQYKIRLTLKNGEITKIDSFADGIIESDWSGLSKPQ